MKKTIQYLLYSLFVVLALTVTGMLIQSWNSLKEMKTRVSTLEEDRQKKNEECLALHQEIYELRNNPHAVEKVAREKWGLVGKDEIIYTFMKDNNKDRLNKIMQGDKTNKNASDEKQATHAKVWWICGFAFLLCIIGALLHIQFRKNKYFTENKKTS